MTKQIFYNFENSIFSQNQKYRWPFSLENAKLIASCLGKESSVFNLLTQISAFDELLLINDISAISHNNFRELSQSDLDTSEFSSTKLTQEEYYSSLPISTWSDEMIIGSIIFFILETDFKSSKNFSFTLPFTIKDLCPLMFNSKFILIFIQILQDTNIIKNNFKECCLAFTWFLSWKSYIFELERQFNFNKNSLINFLSLLKATDIEIEYIVDSCFNHKNLNELKNFVKKSRELK